MKKNESNKTKKKKKKKSKIKSKEKNTKFYIDYVDKLNLRWYFVILKQSQIFTEYKN